MASVSRSREPFPNLRYENVGDMLDDALGNTFLWNEPDHLDEFILNLSRCQVHVAILHPILRHELPVSLHAFHEPGFEETIIRCVVLSLLVELQDSVGVQLADSICPCVKPQIRSTACLCSCTDVSHVFLNGCFLCLRTILIVEENSPVIMLS